MADHAIPRRAVTGQNVPEKWVRRDERQLVWTGTPFGWSRRQIAFTNWTKTIRPGHSEDTPEPECG